MKTKLIKTGLNILLVFLINNSAISQTNIYHPFSIDFTSWVYRDYTFTGQLNENFSNIIWHGDTTINSIVYKKKYINGSYDGAFRQDVINEKLYYLDVMDIEHDVSISYDINVGDTIIVDPIIYNALSSFSNTTSSLLLADTLKVTQVDSILFDNSYRKKIRFIELDQNYNWSDAITYIVGVGFNQLEGFEHGRDLNCYHVNNEQIFGVNSNGGEYFCLNSTKENDLGTLTIYPNPAYDNLTILTELSQFNIKLIDLYGKVVYESQENSNRVSIDISFLSKGLYIAEVTANEKTNLQKVILK